MKNTEYELMLEEVASKCELISFTDEENIQILEELNEGLEEFLLAQKKRDSEAKMELNKIIIR